MKRYIKAFAPALLVLLLGCEEEKSPAQEVATQAAISEVTSPAKKKELTVEATKAAEAASSREAQEAKAQAEIEENPLTECCRALGKQAFTLRSPEYHGASKACGEALIDKKPLTSVLPEIKKSLKDKALPAECSK